MENPVKMDDLGVPLFFGNTHINLWLGIILKNRYTVSIKNKVDQNKKPFGPGRVHETYQQLTQLNLRQISVSKKPAGRLPTKYRSTKAPFSNSAKWDHGASWTPGLVERAES